MAEITDLGAIAAAKAAAMNAKQSPQGLTVMPQPGPYNFEFNLMPAQRHNPDTGETESVTLVLMIIESVLGPSYYFIDHQLAGRISMLLAEKAQEARTGLVVASDFHPLGEE